MSDRQMTQTAPWPTELEDLVGRARCHRGWSFYLEDGTYDDGAVTGLRLFIVVRGVDAYHPDKPRGTAFLFPVPAATFDRASWQRWLWDRVMDVHRHETGEAFSFVYERAGSDRMVTVAEHPFAPFHGPGRDPNRNIEVGVDPAEVRVRQDGGRYEGYWWGYGQVHTDGQHEAGGHRGCVPVQLVESQA